MPRHLSVRIALRLLTFALPLGLALLAGCRRPEGVAEGPGDPVSRAAEPVFRAERKSGLAAALDTLRALTERDSLVQANSHQVAHALGRYAVVRSGYRPDAFARCRPDFLSGCYHGVLEAYLERAPLDSASLAAMCRRLPGPDAPPLAYLECAHGLGHGLSVRRGRDLPRALADCAHLPDDLARGECRDGVFMENVVHGVSAVTVHAGGEGGHHHDSAGGAAADSAGRRWVKADDPSFPCDSVDAGLQPHCWHYQHNVVRMVRRTDLAGSLRACVEVTSAAGRQACARGVGKNVGAEAPLRAAEICGAVPALTGRCIRGAAEYFVDLDWTTPPAHAFCTGLPDALKGDCYALIGERLALIHRSPVPIRADCARAGPAHAPACLKAAGIESD